jgi:hypothetical protein
MRKSLPHQPILYIFPRSPDRVKQKTFFSGE